MSEGESNISFKEPNGSAFVTTETRKGPPLATVGDKLYESLVFTHVACVAVTTYIPDDFPQPPGWKASGLSLKNDGLMEPLRCAFRNGLTAFLSLYNMLALVSNPGLIDCLLKMRTLEFRDWLDRIGRAGCVTG